MKSQILLFLLAIFFASIVQAQNCLPEGITFSTQAQIDSFQVNYPGCSIIEGTVIINGNNITNLNGLSILTVIESDLGIEGNPELHNLSGLNNIIHVDGDLDIGDNEALTDLTGLENLINTGLDFSIEQNSNLLNLSGLGNLKTIGAELVILENDKISSLTGLDNISRIETAITIQGNPQLTSLEGLNSLDSISGGLVITNNSLMESLAGLDSATIVNGPVNIQNNPLLSVCSILSVCNYLNSGGNALIANNNVGCSSIPEVLDGCFTYINNLIEPEDSSISIYPNPCFGMLIVNLKSENFYMVRITNIYNQVIKTLDVSLGENKINVSSLPRGLYFISIHHQSGSKTFKFVKK